MNLNERKIVIVLPAYNAARTLICTLAKIPTQYAGHVILIVARYTLDSKHGWRWKQWGWKELLSLARS